MYLAPGSFRSAWRFRRFCWEGWTGLFRFSRCSARRSAIRFGRGEQIGRQLGSEPRPEDLLGRRGRDRSPLPAVMFRLVTLGSVDPNPAGRINVDRPHRANLSGPHSRETLEFNHRPNLAGDVGPDRVNERIRDRLDRLRLPDVATAPTEAGDRLEAVMDGGRDHSLPHGPLERPDDDAGPVC